MADKPGDPLAGVEPAHHQCGGECGSYLSKMHDACPNCGSVVERLLPEPAVRKAVVEAIRKQADDEWNHGDKFSGSESLNLLADRLEAGGDEE
ncbi:hypothetical protein LCGC14_0427780 [marine sediment metagenome]|uniref:Uncharacterized protein n=1 Tax=marine sediment metagenome TaxID=412755 RepID=A0A0F9VYK2_9ZZZZ